jgi:hypothetical protein
VRQSGELDRDGRGGCGRDLFGARGIDVVYLVHSLGSADFEERDRPAATAVAESAATVHPTQVVYLGGGV